MKKKVTIVRRNKLSTEQDKRQQYKWWEKVAFIYASSMINSTCFFVFMKQRRNILSNRFNCVWGNIFLRDWKSLHPSAVVERITWPFITRRGERRRQSTALMNIYTLLAEWTQASVSPSIRPCNCRVMKNRFNWNGRLKFWPIFRQQMWNVSKWIDEAHITHIARGINDIFLLCYSHRLLFSSSCSWCFTLIFIITRRGGEREALFVNKIGFISLADGSWWVNSLCWEGEAFLLFLLSSRFIQLIVSTGHRVVSLESPC